MKQSPRSNDPPTSGDLVKLTRAAAQQPGSAVPRITPIERECFQTMSIQNELSAHFAATVVIITQLANPQSRLNGL
jgi:hypothetical protein